MAIEAKAAGRAKGGWISLGWSPKGKMSPADAVIGNMVGGLVMPYVIKGYKMSKLQPTSAFKIGDNAATVTTATNDTIITFSRYKNSGVYARFPMVGLTKLIWAFSNSGSPSLAFHGDSYGTAKVDFSCRYAPSSKAEEDYEDEDDDNNDDNQTRRK
ncbi:hypothetical protein CLOP_g16920 [Closterium sp. NIES-67]|nr:hypothetical protein CLOP_g16920 [Closterium sp. NIES-67]